MSAKTGLPLYDRRGSRAMSLSFLLRETPESPKKMKAGVWEDLRRHCRLYMVLSGRAEPSGCSAKLCVVGCKLFRWRRSMFLVLHCFILVAQATPTVLVHLHAHQQMRSEQVLWKGVFLTSNHNQSALSRSTKATDVLYNL